MAKKKHENQDPNAERESQKYEFPIPSREFLLELLGKRGKPMSYSMLIRKLELGEKESTALSFRLKAMLRDGQLLKDRRGRYCLLDKVNLIAGRVDAHPDGFGFLIPDDGSKDMFLSARQMRQVFHGDRVLARQSGTDNRGRLEGSIVEVIEHKTLQTVGIFYSDKDLAWVEPDNRRMQHSIFIPREGIGKARPQDIVMVEITHQPTLQAQAVGKVTEILGPAMAPGMEIEIAIRAFDLPNVWPETVMHEADQMTRLVSKDAEGRLDLRKLPFVTIDGEDAKDFDDAVYCEPLPKGGWKLYVAIADVSHYVKIGSPIDVEAQLRCTSVYFPERVIPMLPEILSNDLCSLRPKEDRPVMVCEMEVSAEGKLMNSHFHEGIIHSVARLTYDDVAARKLPAHVLPHIENLYALYHQLFDQRHHRGAIDFDLPETQIVFDEDRKIKKILRRDRNDAHRLIEECMLLANISAAKYLLHHQLPTLYRIHPEPTPEKISDVREFLAQFGLQLGGGEKPKPSDYAKLLLSIKDRPDHDVIQRVLLYSLSQATYHPDNIGHFGLSFEAYAHFTSPIRRYPDLLVHRAIRHVLRHKSKDGYAYSEREMIKFGEQCSLAERRADEATRDVTAWLKCEYMQQHVGVSFAGIITGVTSFGVFVELKELYVEGMVHVTALSNDYYQYDAPRHCLRGERTRKTYRLGDKIQVRVLQVDLHDRKIHFELVKETKDA